MEPPLHALFVRWCLKDLRKKRRSFKHRIYFVIKDHPFSDGNKRIGSFLFMLYLQQGGMGRPLNPQTLTALALLIAESAPSNKDLMIRLIINLLAEPRP